MLAGFLYQQAQFFIESIHKVILVGVRSSISVRLSPTIEPPNSQCYKFSGFSSFALVADIYQANLGILHNIPVTSDRSYMAFIILMRYISFCMDSRLRGNDNFFVP
jgi:hypothetical protein